MVVTGDSDEERRAASARCASRSPFMDQPRRTAACSIFTGGETCSRGSTNSRESGEWDAMAELIDDDVLDAFSIVAPLDQVAARVSERFTGAIDRFSLYQSETLGDRESSLEIMRSLRHR